MARFALPTSDSEKMCPILRVSLNGISKNPTGIRIPPTSNPICVENEYREMIQGMLEEITASLPSSLCLPRVHDKMIQAYSWHGFFVFDHLLSPLNRSEAKSCLVDFIDKAAASLEALHSLGYAHLDVRLDNKCFKYKGSDVIAVLIDLERMYPKEEAVRKSSGAMYDLQEIRLEAIWSDDGIHSRGQGNYQ